MSREDRFLKACRLEKVDCTPVWFMRQAGRYMKNYRDIREKHGLMEMFKNPEIAAEVTLQPVRAFPLDAAIIFADILLPLEGMGIEFDFAPGPVMRNPVRSARDVHALRIADPEADLGFVLQSLKFVRAEIDGKVPLIGFAGAPFTLACYAMQDGASSNGFLTKQLMYADPSAWDLLMDKLTRTIIAYVKSQISAGAQVVQLFDSWVGHLSPSDYRKFALPYSRRIFAAIRELGVPSIHFGTGTAGFLDIMKEAGSDVIGADWRVSLEDAWIRIGPDCGIQGNLDPALLFAPQETLRQNAAAILDQAAGRRGHVFNLGHGIHPSTPEDAVKSLADFVHEYSSRKAVP